MSRNMERNPGTNYRVSLDAAITFCLYSKARGRRASEKV